MRTKGVHKSEMLRTSYVQAPLRGGGLVQSGDGCGGGALLILRVLDLDGGGGVGGEGVWTGGRGGGGRGRGGHRRSFGLKLQVKSTHYPWKDRSALMCVAYLYAERGIHS